MISPQTHWLCQCSMKCYQVCLMLFSFTEGKEKNPALHEAKRLIFPSKKEKPVQVFTISDTKKDGHFAVRFFYLNFLVIFLYSITRKIYILFLWFYTFYFRYHFINALQSLISFLMQIRV